MSDVNERSRLDEAVKVACDAFLRSNCAVPTVGHKEMRAALLAALPVLLGPLVQKYRTEAESLRQAAGRAAKREQAGFDPPVPHTELWQSATDADAYASELELIYAPSLGEGHE